jgi:energy-coupling factor transport system permease protein
MNVLPAYRPTGSGLHRAPAGVAVAYIAVPVAAAMLFDHPLVLLSLLAALLLAGAAAGVAAELGRAARFGLPLAIVVALVNPLVSHEGLTVFWHGPVVPVLGRLDFTLEALAWGGVAGLRALDVVLAFALYSAVVDPDEVLRAARRVSLRSALTASAATRLVPVLARDAERLGEFYEFRAAAPAQGGGWGARVRRSAVMMRALAAGALERAVDAAAALEVRGYGAAPARLGRRRREPLSAGDWVVALSALAGGVALVAGRLAGLADFDPYPSIEVALGGGEAALVLALPGAMLLPFVGAPLRRTEPTSG